MPTVNWSDIQGENSGTSLNWSDIAPDEPQLASGTQQRMAQYQGLSPTEAAGKYRQSWGDAIKHAASVVSDPSKLGAAIKGMAEKGYEAGTHPLETLHNVTKYYYENPDVLATDVASMGMPLGYAGKAGKLAEGGEALYNIEGVPFTRADAIPKPEMAPKPTETPMARTARIKAEAGAGIQAAKDSGATVPASEAQGLLDKIKKDTASEYNPETHDAARGFLKKFETYLPEEDTGEADTSAMMSRMAPVPRASLEKKLAELGPKEEGSVSVKDLHNLRQELNDVHKHAYRNGYEQEGKFASKAKAHIDEFMADKMDQEGWSRDMRNYALASTAEEIKHLVDRALYRKTNLSQGQRAAALNTELRQWARPTIDRGPNARMRMLRKLSPKAADQMEALATAADPKSDILKIIGTAAPTSIVPFALDEYAGHLSNAVLGTHLGPAGIMLGGAAAKYYAGKKVMRGIDDIIETLNNAAEIEKFDDLVSKPVGDKLAANPTAKQAVVNWAKAKGTAKRTAARVLAVTIARSLNTPKLVPRIEQEINDLDSSDVPKTEAKY